MRRPIAFSLFLVLFLMGLAPLSFGATSGLDFLKLGIGARPLALGEAYVAIADDINAIYWNPAGLVQLKLPEVGFTYNKWFEDIGYHFLGYGHPVNDSVFAASIYYLGGGDIDGSDGGGSPIGDISAYDLAFAFSYGRKLTDKLSGGLTFKFIRENLDNEAGNAFAFDLSALYKAVIDNLDLGFNVQNIGTGIKFIKDSASLPLNYKFGLAYRLLFTYPLTFSLDFNKLNNEGGYFGLGAECWITEYLALRIGHKFDTDVKDKVRVGLGLKAKNLRLDYAYTPHKILGDTHQFSFGFYFGRLEEKEEALRREEAEAKMASLIASFYEEGMAYFAQERYVEAIGKFSEILLLDPENRTALNMMKEANRLLMERD